MRTFLLALAAFTLGFSAVSAEDAPPLELLPGANAAQALADADIRKQLAAAAAAGDLEATRAILPELFAHTSTPDVRSRALLTAARGAALAEDATLAFTYVDWALEEAEKVDAADLHAHALAASVEIAARLGDRSRANALARQFAQSAPRIVDLFPNPAVTVDGPNAVCPDVVAWRYVRARVDVEDPRFGGAATCYYAVIGSVADAYDLSIEISRSPATVNEVIDAVVSGRLKTLPLLTTVFESPLRKVERSRLRIGRKSARVAFVLHRGRGDVANISGAAALRTGDTLIVAAGRATLEAWPPEQLSTVLSEALAAASGADAR